MHPITMTITMIYNDLQPIGIQLQSFTIQLHSFTMTIIMIYNDLQPITIQLQSITINYNDNYNDIQ